MLGARRIRWTASVPDQTYYLRGGLWGIRAFGAGPAKDFRDSKPQESPEEAFQQLLRRNSYFKKGRRLGS